MYQVISKYISILWFHILYLLTTCTSEDQSRYPAGPSGTLSPARQKKTLDRRRHSTSRRRSAKARTLFACTVLFCTGVCVPVRPLSLAQLATEEERTDEWRRKKKKKKKRKEGTEERTRNKNIPSSSLQHFGIGHEGHQTGRSATSLDLDPPFVLAGKTSLPSTP